VSCNWYRPEQFKGKGKYPLAYWLVEQGEQWAREHYPATDPKSHGETRAELNILHDLLRTDVRTTLYEFADRIGAEIGCRKTDLAHTIKPDDLYEITKGKTIRLFTEVERVKKSYEEMYDKLEPYVKLRGSHDFKDNWGFSYFTVIIPMRDIESMQNLIVHFRGACNCADYRFRKMHKKAQFRLESKHLWFTTTESLLHNTHEKIFFNTADSIPHSLLDLIQ
jgi:hypothetical protein